MRRVRRVGGGCPVLAHPATPHLQGILPTNDGPLLVAQVNRYDSPGGGEHWIGCVRLVPVTGRMATSEEACAAVEEAWAAVHHNERTTSP
jgi:hypothetical protein